MSGREILIAGGGIGGLAAALALAQKGRKVRVLEKAAEFGEIGYGIQMGPNVARMLERLGVLKALEPASVFPEALIFADALTNEEISRISLGKAFVARYQFRYFVIHRRDLHGGLLEACKRREEIVLSPSHGLKAFKQEKDAVTVTCDNGTQFEGAALIGADGLWSPTRAGSMTIWGGPDLHMVQYRLQGGAVMNNVATICSRRIRRGEPNPGAPDELEEIFARTHSGVRDNLRYVSRERNWVLHDRDPATSWTDGRVTLLGDAAHPTLQYLAQGAQMAIEDGVVLAEKVAAAGENYNRAFLAYQRERMNRSARVVLSSRFFGEYIHVDGGARELRNELARGRDPDHPWEVDWLYKGIEVNSKL